MAIQVTNATVLANNEPVGIIPNSLKFTEGKGEQRIRPVSVGDGRVEQVFTNDLETNFAKLMFTMPTTIDSIKLARQWKSNGNQNVFQIAGSTPDGEITRSFTQAAVINDYEVNIGVEGDIEIEIQSNETI
jgi:hypothetical protein